MSALRLIGLLGSLALFAFIFWQYRRRRYCRGEFILGVLIVGSLAAVSIFPDVVNRPREIVRVPTRLMLLSVLANLTLFTLVLYILRELSSLRRSVTELVRALARAEYHKTHDSRAESGVVVVVPAYNEEAGLRSLLPNLPGQVWKLFNAILRRAACVVPTSSYLGIQIQVRADVPSWRIVPVPISVDVQMFCRRTTDEARLLLDWGREPVVFSATNFRFPEKFAGLERLLPWMRSAMERHPTLRWLVAGAGPGLPGFRRRAAAVLGGSAGRLETPGYIQDLATHYQACNAVIHFTDLDAFPRTVLEAQGCGRVVLASASGGVPEMITDQVSGFLVEPGEMFLSILLRVLADPELQRTIGDNARSSVVQRFSPERVGERWRGVFDMVGRGGATAWQK